MASRRDFLRALAASLGLGMVAAGCGGSGGGGFTGSGSGLAGGAPPNGYIFTKVINGSSLTLPTRNRSDQMGAPAALKDEGASANFESVTGTLDLTNGELIFFQAVDDQESVGLYRANHLNEVFRTGSKGSLGLPFLSAPAAQERQAVLS